MRLRAVVAFTNVKGVEVKGWVLKGAGRDVLNFTNQGYEGGREVGKG